MANPGSEERRHLRLKIPHLDDQRFALFSYALCKRLEPLYLQFFGDADLHQSVCDVLQQAALGRRDTQARAEELRQRLEAIVTELGESDDTDYPLEVVKMLAASLQRLAPREFDEIDHGYLAAQDAAGATGLPTMDADIEEEARAQLVLLNQVGQIDPTDPAALQALPMNAPWVQRFEQIRGG